MKKSYQSKSKRKLRVVFMGNPGYGGQIFSELLKKDIEIIAAFTKSNNLFHIMKKFIKSKLSSTKKLTSLSRNLIENLELFNSEKSYKSNFGESIKVAAKNEKVKFFDASTLTKERNISAMKKWNIDLILVATFSEILSNRILDLPKYGCINIHPSLLPKYRGGFPEFCTIYDGEKSAGVTFHVMESKFDTGPIIYQKTINLEEGTNTTSLKILLCKLACENLGKVLAKIQFGILKTIEPANPEISYCNLNSNTRVIDKTMSIFQIKNKILAHQGDNWDPYFFDNDKKVRVLSYGDSGYCFSALDGKIYFDKIQYRRKIYSGRYINEILPSI